MSEKEIKIIDAIKRAMPKLSELDKERLLAFGEGMAFKAERDSENIDARKEA